MIKTEPDIIYGKKTTYGLTQELRNDSSILAGKRKRTSQLGGGNIFMPSLSSTDKNLALAVKDYAKEDAKNVWSSPILLDAFTFFQIFWEVCKCIFK